MDALGTHFLDDVFCQYDGATGSYCIIHNNNGPSGEQVVLLVENLYLYLA